jgi:GrpB-like predicted nucleotidyltransferase (UPF0157 family)
MPAILLVAYDPAWPELFEAERARVLAAIGQHVSAVEHVGGTSVPGLGARPIIDVLVGLPHFSAADACIEPLKRLGYGFRGEVGIPQRYFFRKPDVESWADRTHHLHLVEQESPEWKRMLRFRDYLRAHPEEAQAYDDLKRELAAELETNPLGYPEAKSEFITGVLAKAELDLRR